MKLENTIKSTLEKVQKLQELLEKYRSILYNEYFQEKDDLKSDFILSNIQEIDRHILSLEKCKTTIKDTENYI